MSDKESLSESDSVLKEDLTGCKQMSFVRTLKDYPILLSKSQVPGVKKQKSAAMTKLIADYEKRSGIRMTEKQVGKKLNNMRTDIKSKTDKTKPNNIFIFKSIKVLVFLHSTCPSWLIHLPFPWDIH